MITTYMICEAALEYAELDFETAWVRDEEKLKTLKDYCDALDLILERFEGESFSVEVDCDRTILLTVCVSGLESRDPVNGLIAQLIRRSLGFDLAWKDEEHIALRLRFPGIWAA